MRRPLTPLVALCCLAVEPAAAQEVRTGVRLGGTVAYDSNVLRGNAVRGGSKTADVRLTPSVDVDVSHRFGRADLSLTGLLGYDFFRRYKFLNRQRIQLDGDAKFKVGAFCGVDVQPSIDLEQSDLAEIEQRVGNTSRQRSVAATADCTRKVGLSPTLTGESETITNGSQTRRRYNVQQYKIGGGMAYQRPSIGTFQLLYAYSDIQHPNRPRIDGATGDTTTVQSISIGFDRAVSSRLQASVEAGWLSTRTRDGLARSFSGVGWQSSVRYSPSPRLAVRLQSVRDVRVQGNFSSSYLILTRVALAADYHIGHRTRLSGSLSYDHRSIKGEDQLSVLPLRRWDRTFAGDIGLQYALTAGVQANIGVGHRSRTAGNRYYDFASTTALAGIRLRF